MKYIQGQIQGKGPLQSTRIFFCTGVKRGQGLEGRPLGPSLSALTTLTFDAFMTKKHKACMSAREYLCVDYCLIAMYDSFSHIKLTMCARTCRCHGVCLCWVKPGHAVCSWVVQREVCISGGTDFSWGGGMGSVTPNDRRVVSTGSPDTQGEPKGRLFFPSPPLHPTALPIFCCGCM